MVCIAAIVEVYASILSPHDASVAKLLMVKV